MVLRLISEVVAMCGHGVAPLQTDGGRRARGVVTKCLFRERAPPPSLRLTSAPGNRQPTSGASPNSKPYLGAPRGGFQPMAESSVAHEIVEVGAAAESVTTEQ